ncbi:MAG: 30S ribosome-binding factor RbfA [Bacteroidota bacterium]
MAQSISVKRIARLLQKELGEIFAHKTSQWLGNMMIIVTEVSVSPDLGLAKVYLSFILGKNKALMLASVEQHKGTIRKLLGNQVGSKLRKVPDLRFYLDDSMAQAMRIQQLLDGLDIPEDTNSVQSDEGMW